MALPALGILPHLLAASDNLLRRRRPLSDVQRGARRLLGEISIRLRGLGAVNGQLLPKTVSAIKAFQKDAGLTVDGKASPSLLAFMHQLVGKS